MKNIIQIFKKNQTEMFRIIDEEIASYLECSVDDYIHYVEKVCNENEREYFIETILDWIIFSKDMKKAKKMKEIFCSYNNHQYIAQKLKDMKKDYLKINLNGKEVCINTLEYLGDEVVDGNTLEVFGNKDFVFFFETEEYIDTQCSNNGDGDIEWKTITAELAWLEFYLDIENGDNSNIIENRLRLSTELEEAITKICNQKYYNVVEL